MSMISRLAIAGFLAMNSPLAAEPGFGPPEGGPDLAMMDEGGPGPGMGGPGMGGPSGHEGGPGMHGGMGGPERMLEQLELSDAQKAKLKELKRARRDKNQVLRNKAEDLREDLKDLMESTDRSKAQSDKIRAKHEELQKIQNELGKDRIESMLEIREILTDAQLKKFVELKKKGPESMRGEMRQWMKKRMDKKMKGHDDEGEHEHGDKP